MMTNITEINEELDNASLNEHLRNSDVRNFTDPGYLQFTNYEKTSDAGWAGLLSRHKSTVEESSPQHSHLSPESSTLSDLASFEYSQRLPSLESSSSAPISRATYGLTPQSLLAWQPFGTSSSLHSQASSIHGPSGHLFPLVSGSVGAYGTEFPAHSSSNSTTALSLACGVADSRDKPVSQFNQLTYANVSAALAASGRLRATVTSPNAHDLQPIRMDLASSANNNNNQLPVATSISAYAASVGSSNSQSSTPAHQGFSFPSNGATAMQQLSGTPGTSLPSHSYDDHSKSVTFKQRSKKESHNRIERKRRDYINSQIVYLSSLLPPELYRDVDGRRNKGSVLRLSVNYIKDLRDAVSRMAGLKQENTLARQLIPLLLKRIETLERIVHDPVNKVNTHGSSTSLHHSASFESLYQSWLLVNESNHRVSSNGNPAVACSGSRAGPPFNSPLNEANFFPDLMQTDADATELELAVPTSSTSDGKSRLVNVKREQSEEGRLAESAPSRVRMESCRIPVGCGNSRSTFAEIGALSNRIDEEPAHSMSSTINFDSQSNLSYERYHRLMQPTCQPGVFGHNE